MNICDILLGSRFCWKIVLDLIVDQFGELQSELKEQGEIPSRFSKNQ
jgi:hypothetical protein